MTVILSIVATAIIVSLSWAVWLERLKSNRAIDEIKRLNKIIGSNILPAVLENNSTMEDMTKLLEAFFLTGQWQLVRTNRDRDDDDHSK